MLRDEATIQPALYRLPERPVGPLVLIPAFRAATAARGAFGWFTVGWVARLAPGLAEYLNRDDTAPIEFTVAPALFPAEKETLTQAVLDPTSAAERVRDVFWEGRVTESALTRHAIDCLAWMVATGKLRLRIAVPTPESNYHPKIWLFADGLDQVLARGSGNATSKGTHGGVEHLDVDVSWIEFSSVRVREGMAMLDDWSKGRSIGIKSVHDLPQAIEDDIVTTAPDVLPTPEGYAAAVEQDGHPHWAFDRVAALRKRFLAVPKEPETARLTIPSGVEWEHGNYAHQAEAVTAWEEAPEAEHGTIAMATGAGKTIASLICATRAQDRRGGEPFLLVVSAPSTPLVLQWVDEVKRFGVDAVAPTVSGKTDQLLTTAFRRLSRGGTQALVVTNNLLCSPNFQRTLELKTTSGGRNVRTMLIADEAHTLGAEGFLNNKPEVMNLRLALSATPERQYDPDGTEEVFAFFGPPVYEFGLDRAIGFCLSEYDYHVHAATLAGEELDEFTRLTERIGAAIGREADEDALTKLSIARRRIIETAEAKIELLRRVLQKRGPRTLTHALIYASAKNPEQFEQIRSILDDLSVRYACVTQETTARPRKVQEIFEAFDGGGYQVLLAKKVLDEGVDIPSIREAFIVASSTIQREWVQRRGRVLRRHESKQWAILHDFLALPPATIVMRDRRTATRKIIRTELDRAYSFAASARNAAGPSGVIANLERIRCAYWPRAGIELVLQEPGDLLVAPGTPEKSPW